VSGLFRQQALDAASESSMGSIHLATPLARKVYATVVFALFLACLGFVFFGSYTSRITADGQIISSTGVVQLYAERSAIVSGILVSVGQHVRKGQPLIRYSTRQASGRLEDVDAKLANEIGEQAALLSGQIGSIDRSYALKARDAHRRLALLRAQQAQVRHQATLLAEQSELLQARMQKYESLRESRYISELEFDSHRKEALAAQVQLDDVRGQASQLDMQVSGVENEIASLPLEVVREKDGIKGQVSQLDQAMIQVQARRDWQVLSPVDGIVVTLPVKPGLAVKAGRLVTTVLPRGSRMQAVLLVPGTAAGLVEPSQPVLMRMDAFPYQKFGHLRGRIAGVDRNPTSEADVAEIYGMRAQQPAYLASIVLAGQSVQDGAKRYDILPGMHFQADVMLERRRLIEWIAGPIAGFKQKLFG
jgi:membrane fusion protein